MITKISGEQPFQVLTSAFSISPSASGYQLQISADGVNYSTLFSVGAGVTRLVTGVAANSYYKLAGNTSDVVVNWQKSCNGGEGGGGGTGSTITVDSELSTASTNPVENRVITNALNNLPGTEVDDELSSSSTNPVENRVIYEALNGVTSSTQLEIIESATTSVYLETRGSGNFYFKETNLPGYLAINLGENITGDTSFRRIDTGTRKYFADAYGGNITNATLGVKCPLGPSGSDLWFSSSNLDGTYNYYMVYNQVDDYVVVYKNLPVITEVSDHAANISDLPVAQDGSDTKYYAYSGDNFKKIISNVYPWVSTNTPDSGATRRVDSYINYTVWNSNQSQQTEGSPIPTGNEYYPGLKTSRDSEVIDNAMEALSGLTESITLTLGNQSTDYITFGGQNFYLFETDNPKYLAIPASGATRYSMCGFEKIVLSNTDYYSLNSGNDSVNDLTGVYQLATYKNYMMGSYQRLSMLMGGKYFIIDKELKLFIVSDSLTITRAKNIQEALNNIQPDMSDYVSKDELTGSTEQQAIEIGADDTGATITIYGPNGLETLNLKSTSVNKYKVLDISGWATSTNIWPQFFSYSGISQMGFQDFVMMALDTPYTLTQGEGNHSQITFSGTSPRYIVLNIEDNTVYVSDNLPSVAVEVPGVLDDYWTTGETQTAIEEALYGAIITGATIPIDDHLDSASTWPVENRVITNKFGDYYNKSEVDAKFVSAATEVGNAIDAAVQGLASEDYVDNAVSGLASEDYVDAAVTAATQNFVTEQYVTNEITAATQNLVTEEYVDNAIASAFAVDDALDTGSTNPVENRVVTNALNTKVQSTDVRTMVKCTLAEYNAMQSHDPYTFYIIVNS